MLNMVTLGVGRRDGPVRPVPLEIRMRVPGITMLFRCNASARRGMSAFQPIADIGPGFEKQGGRPLPSSFANMR